MSVLSHRLAKIAPSATIEMSARAATLKATGADVVTLSAGEPDFDTPAHIAQAGISAIEQGHTRYTQPDGLPALKEAVSAKFARENGLSYGHENLIICAGGKHVLFNAFMASVNTGDEVLFAAPYWVSYPDMVRLCGGTPIAIPTRAAEGYRLMAADLEAAITARSKWLVLNSPSNPSGAVLTHADLEALADVLRRHPQVWVLCDDIYEHLTYEGTEFATLAQVAPDLADRVLTMNGVSKSYAMTGWRIGYAGGPSALIAAMRKVQMQSTSNPCTISQYAAIAALDGPQDAMGQNKALFEARRNRVMRHLAQIDGISCPKAQGAFYLYPDISGLIGKCTPSGKRLNTDQEFAMAFLEEQHVALVFGSAFGLSPNLRISYAASEPQLDTACTRLAQFCASLTE